MVVDFQGKPVEFGNFILKPDEGFEGFVKERDRVFSNPDLSANLSTFVTEGNIKNSEQGYEFLVATEMLIEMGTQQKIKGNLNSWYGLYAFTVEEDIKSMVKKIIDFVSFESKEEAKKYLPDQFGLEGEKFFNSLYLSFAALTLIDPKIESRFEVGCILNQNKKALGCAGYSEKLQRNLPFFLTFFEKKLIFVDVVKGIVETISFKEKIKKLYIKNGKLWCNDFELAERQIKDGIDGIKFYFPFDERQRDFREAERAAKRKKGKKVKETSWRTVGLGSLRGSNKTVKEHILIALMVFGINPLRFVLMEGSSWWTIDHKNSIHDDNRLDNLDLLPRKANNSKGATEKQYFDWFFYLSGFPLEKCS